MKNNVCTLLLAVSLMGCAGQPKKEDLIYMEHQVYQCKMACTSGVVTQVKIAEMGCECNNTQPNLYNQPAQPQVIVVPPSPQAPVIINNVIPGPSYQTVPVQSSARAPATLPENEVELEAKGVQVQLSSGRTIFSSSK